MTVGDLSNPSDPSERAAAPERAAAAEGAAAPDPTDRAIDLTPTTPGRTPAAGTSQPAYDPLRLCVFATVALLAWLAGPWALAFFAGLGFVGYWRARRAGLLRSRCVLGDTRLVLLYLGSMVVVAVAAIAWSLTA